MIINKLKNRFNNLYLRKYDYYYLLSTFNKDIDDIDTIIAGSSYACFGINPNSNSVNIGLPSQDIYYSDKLIRLLLDKYTNTKKVILVLGYYSLYSDLSYAKSIAEKERIKDVYYPLLHDRHHQVLDKKTIKDSLKDIFDIISELLLKNKLNSIDTYFTSDHSRFSRRLIIEGIGGASPSKNYLTARGMKLVR